MFKNPVIPFHYHMNKNVMVFHTPLVNILEFKKILQGMLATSGIVKDIDLRQIHSIKDLENDNKVYKMCLNSLDSLTIAY